MNSPCKGYEDARFNHRPPKDMSVSAKGICGFCKHPFNFLKNPDGVLVPKFHRFERRWR